MIEVCGYSWYLSTQGRFFQCEMAKGHAGSHTCGSERFSPEEGSFPKFVSDPPVTQAPVRLPELERARLNRLSDNTKIKPIELLKLLIDDIERGDVKCDGLVVLVQYRPNDADWEHSTYRCNMRRDEELVAIVLAQERTIRDWIHPDK